MTLHTNRIEAMLYMIEQSGVNPSDIERTTGINRGQVYRWQARSISNIRLESISLVAGALGYTFKEVGKQIELSRDSTKTELDYYPITTIQAQVRTIELLEEKIASQEKELAKLQSNESLFSKMKKTPGCENCLKILGQA